MMQPTTLRKIDQARRLAGIPFIINSGYRSPEHNAKVGGVPNSSHIRGYAVDVRCTTSSDRLKIVKAAMDAGFHRIGIYKTFVHMDDDPSKGAAMWIR